MSSTRSRRLRFVWLSPLLAVLAACSRQAPTSADPTATAVAASASPDRAASPLPGVIGQPSDVTASQHTQTAPSNGATAVGGLSARPENGTTDTGGSPAPTGGDAAPGHAASPASQ